MSGFISKTLHTTALAPTHIHQHTHHNTIPHTTLHHATPHSAPATPCDMSETQHHCPQQDQDHFIQSGTKLAQETPDSSFLSDASNSTNREHAKAHALWPLLLCVAVALRRVGVGGVVFFLYVWWCCVVFCSCVCGVSGVGGVGGS